MKTHIYQITNKSGQAYHIFSFSWIPRVDKSTAEFAATSAEARAIVAGLKGAKLNKII